MLRVFRLKNYTHDPARRKRRFRCLACDRLIPDGDSPVIERRGRTSRGIHSTCWATGGLEVDGVKARAQLNGENPPE